MFTNKKGQDVGVGFVFIWLLITIFMLGLYFIMSNYVLDDYITPISQELINNNAFMNATEKTEQLSHVDSFNKIWYSIPLITVATLLLFVILNTTKPKNQVY